MFITGCVFSVVGYVGIADREHLGLDSHRGGMHIILFAIRVINNVIRDFLVRYVIRRIELMLIGKWCNVAVVEGKQENFILNIHQYT